MHKDVVMDEFEFHRAIAVGTQQRNVTRAKCLQHFRMRVPEQIVTSA